MSAQGVPGVIMISREVREFRKQYDATCQLFNNRVTGLEETMEKALAEIPNKICEVLLQHFLIKRGNSLHTSVGP